ncbi:MAG: tannase/feruloyl esterase family alpha/beta hydrolase [Sphingomonas sp.]
MAPPPSAATARVEGCAALAGLALANGKVDAAMPVARGAVVSTDAARPGLPALGAFCRVQATLSAGPGSSVKIEVWLPERAAWNGKLLGAGNGGFGDNLTIPSLLMRGGVGKGYAAVGSDMGHAAVADVKADWALNAPEKIKDFGWRANHLAAVAAKQVVGAYYAAPLAASYFHGCSDGGREALMEAQRFPDDYDAIIAGAPAIPWTRMTSAFAANHLAAHGRPESVIPNTKLKLLQAASLAQCDKADGVADGVIDDPRGCRFDPGVLQCRNGDGADCLTAPQVEAARAIYRGPVGPGGKPFYFGFQPGAEAVPGTWDLWLTGPNAQHGMFATEFMRNMVHSDPNWQIARFDLRRDYPLARRTQGATLDADNPDLRTFFRRGGKLLMYHGWQDAAIPPENSIAYFERVQRASPAQARDSARLFMVPGMSHCLAGPGPNIFDALGTLDGWRQGGPAPETMVATKFDNDLFAYLGFPAKPIRTRALCAYPRVARWSGHGSSDDAATFTCVGPER